MSHRVLRISSPTRDKSAYYDKSAEKSIQHTRNAKSNKRSPYGPPKGSPLVYLIV
jgi:hypothetical protein